MKTHIFAYVLYTTCRIDCIMPLIFSDSTSRKMIRKLRLFRNAQPFTIIVSNMAAKMAVSLGRDHMIILRMLLIYQNMHIDDGEVAYLVRRNRLLRGNSIFCIPVVIWVILFSTSYAQLTLILTIQT